MADAAVANAPQPLVRRSDRLFPGEKRAWYYWDTITINNGNTTLEFFAFRDGPAGKTVQQTNIRLAGQVSAGHLFRIGSIMIRPAMGTTLAGAVVPLSVANWNVIKPAVIELEVGNIIKFQTILPKLPAGGGYFGSFAASNAAAAFSHEGVQNGYPTPVAAARIEPKVRLTPNENFLVRFKYMSAPNPSVNTPISVWLGGILERAYQ